MIADNVDILDIEGPRKGGNVDLRGIKEKWILKEKLPRRLPLMPDG
jgi:hypothetical protein